MLFADHAAHIALAFGLGSRAALSGPVARGEVGQVWELTTDAGRFAVKEPFRPDAFDGADDEADFQDAAVAAGVRAPRVLRTTAGAVVATVDGSPLRVYEWVDLRPPDRTLDPAAVGAVIARLHQVRRQGTNPTDHWYTDPIGACEWDSLCVSLHEHRAPFADRFTARRPELVALDALVEPSTDVQTCHRDLFADNVLATVTGDVCIIDWENSGLADPSYELALVLFEFAGADTRRAGDLCRAYRDHGGPGVVDRQASFSMAVAQLGHIGHLAATRWLANSEPAQRARNEARVDEFLEDGITFDHIDAILHAVAR